jgi:hypothetical protein
MKLKSLTQRRDLMKESFVKVNYMISKGILSVSRLHSTPIVREKAGRKRVYCGRRCSINREPENKTNPVS